MLYFIMGRDEILFSKYRVEVIAGAFVLGACRTYVCVLNPTLYDSIWRVLIFGEGVLMVQKSSFREKQPKSDRLLAGDLRAMDEQ